MRKEGRTGTSPTVVIFCSLVSLYSFSRCHCGRQRKSSIFLPPDLSSPAPVLPSFGGCNPGLSRYEGEERRGRGGGGGGEGRGRGGGGRGGVGEGEGRGREGEGRRRRGGVGEGEYEGIEPLLYHVVIDIYQGKEKEGGKGRGGEGRGEGGEGNEGRRKGGTKGRREGGEKEGRGIH